MFQDMQIPVLPIGGGETQKLIAPIQDTLIANKAYSIGEEFIYSGVLFKVITAIPNGGNIILDGSSANVEVADTLTEQINTVSKQTQFGTASGTTFAQLWTFINSLNNRQKDSLVLTINSPNRANGVIRRTLQNQYEGFSSGGNSISVMLLTTNDYYFRSYKFDSTAPATTVETITSWSAVYVL